MWNMSALSSRAFALSELGNRDAAQEVASRSRTSSTARRRRRAAPAVLALGPPQRAVDRLHDLQHAHLGRGAPEGVSALHAR